MQEGWINRVEPFYLPEEAFFELQDAYVWRGRVRKRFGYSLIGDTDLDSRLRVDIGTTDGNGDISTTVPGTDFSVGQMFSIGTERFTVYQTGTPANMYISGSATLATYNTTTGAVVINGADATTSVYFYPAQPVMGLLTLETSNINQETLIAFDQQFSYKLVSGAWERITGGSATWTGSDSNFFWGVNYRSSNPYTNVLYVVNNNDTTPDNIRYLNSGATTWTNLRPQLDSGATRFLETSRVLINFKDRLLAINTQETDTGAVRNFFNRARWSQNGDPTAAATSWLDDTPGRGGYIDAPTEEAAITAERLRDRLVVYFERSTWELVYTGNEAAPFRWQQLNSELGCESTFSVIGFDKTAIGVGNVGVHECNGVNVYRIDEKIPYEVFKIHNGNSGPERVYGIRDYYNELVYWTFPDDNNSPTYPNRVLVYNYSNKTWAIFNDSFTCFGYYQDTDNITWADLGAKYGTWAAWTTPWGSPLYQAAVPEIVAGNQQGFVFVLDTDRSSNCQAMYLTNITVSGTTVTFTSINHNLKVGEYFLVSDATGITDLNGNIYKVETTADADTFTVTIDPAPAGTYTGSGLVTRVSNIYILSKQFNPGTPIGQQFRIPYVDFLLNRTDGGQVTLDTFLDTSSNPINDSTTTGIILGTQVLYTQPEDIPDFQPNQQQIWHRFYIPTQSAFLQFLITMDDAQMTIPSIAQSDFEMHAILIYAEPQGRIIG
jgi:hypothetical protein